MHDNWNWRDHGGCPRCGAQDHGFREPDLRAQYLLKTMSKPQADDEPEVDYGHITITIDRRWRDCPDCHEGTVFDAVYVVRGPAKSGDGTQSWECAAMHIAEKTVKELWPAAKIDSGWLEDRAEARMMMRMGGQW
jgi:ribosomal protein S27AE